MKRETEPQWTRRLFSFLRGIETRYANSFLGWLLRSGLHGLASRWLVLITYEGKKSSRQRTITVAYRERGDQLITVSPETETVWWKNFEEPRECTVWYRGKKRTATGKRIVAPETHQTLILSYFQKFGWLGWIFGFGGNPVVSDRALNRAKKSLVVVLFTLERRDR